MRRGLVISLVIAAGTAALAAPAGFTVQDLVAMDRLSELASSSAHSRLAFTVSTLDREANRRRTDIWTVDARDGGSPGPPDRRPGQRHQPGVEPGRAGHLLPVVAQRLVPGLADVRQPGRRGDAGDEVPARRRRLRALARRAAARGRARGLRRLRGPRPARPIASPPPRSARRPAASTTRCCSATGTRGRTGGARTCSSRRSTCSTRRRTRPRPIDVMKGMDADGPSKPFGGAEEFTFTPDSRGLVFTARDAGREEAWSTNLDLWVAPLDGSQKPRNLTAANKGTDVGPVFSPDGTQLAYRSMARAGYEADKLRIMLVNWATPRARDRVVAAAWDRSPNELVWSTQRQGALRHRRRTSGQQSLFAIDVATGTAQGAAREGHGRRARAREDRGRRRRRRARRRSALPRRGAGRVDRRVRRRAGRPHQLQQGSARRRRAWATPSSSRSRAGTARRCTATS